MSFTRIQEQALSSRPFNEERGSDFYSLFPVFGLVWFGLVLSHIRHCRSFNAKSVLYIHIRYLITNTFCR